MKNNIDKTVQYDPKPELDEILNTFEKTSDSVENIEEEKPENEVIENSDNDKKAVPKKKLIIIAAAICVLIIIGAVFLFSNTNKEHCGIVVKRTDGTFAVCSSDGTEKIEMSVKEYKYSPDKNVMAFIAQDGKLYACLLNDNAKTEPVTDKTDNGYFVTNTALYYLKDGKLNCFDTQNNKNEEISNGVNTLKVSENGNMVLFTKLNDKKTELYILGADGSQPNLLSSDIKSFAIFDDGNSVVFAEGDTVKVYSLSGDTKTVSDGVSDFYFPENENGDNIYFFKESDTVGRTSIVFEDKMKESDSALKEPNPDDYKKNLGILGIIQYTDSKAYKQAYLEYQDKLARDNAREFAENYVSSQSEVTFYDVYCYYNNSSSKIADGIVPEKAVSYTPTGTPRVLYEKVITSVSTTLEISDIAKEISGGDSQQDFNALVDSKATSGTEDCGLYVSSPSGDFSAGNAKISEDSEVSFSPDGNILLVHSKNGENIHLASYRLSDGSVRKQFDEDVKAFDFCANSFWVLKTDNTLSCCAVSGNYADCDTRAENVTYFSVENGGEVVAVSDGNAYIIGENNKTLVLENVTDVCYVGKNKIFCLSENKLFFFDGKNTKEIEDSISEILF